MPATMDTEAKSKEAEHKSQYLKPYHGPAQHCFSMEAKNFKLGASDPSLNLYVNMEWNKTKYLGVCTVF